MGPKILAANWKMHKTFGEGLELAQNIVRHLRHNPRYNLQIILMPPFMHLEAISRLIYGLDKLYIGAQNCHEKSDGAFTGEISAPMLRSIGTDFVLIGHSERRQYFGENSPLLAKKISTALEYGLRPIFCFGEDWKTKTQATTFLRQQLSESLFHLSHEQISQVILAYEPIWAIGTEKLANLDQIQTICKIAKNMLAQQYNDFVAASIPILYGGSCNHKNISRLFTCSAVDGGLIGKASLEAHSFIDIIKAMPTK